jgi:hypothetical protein
MFWGDRHGQVICPFGHRWGISQQDRPDVGGVVAHSGQPLDQQRDLELLAVGLGHVTPIPKIL